MPRLFPEMAGPSAVTIKRLFAVSGNRCTFPGRPHPYTKTALATFQRCRLHLFAGLPYGSDLLQSACNQQQPMVGTAFIARETDKKAHGRGCLRDQSLGF